MKNMFTDTHAHIYKEYYEDINEILKIAKSNNVNRVIISGATQKNNEEVISLVKKYSNVYGTLSIHPEYALNYNDCNLKYIEDHLKYEKIVAIGEIGLDYYWTKETIEEQKILFEKQLRLAELYNMPVVIHSRDATNDTIEILKKFKVKGVIHAFSGSLETALIYVKMGFCLGIGGVVTFKNSKLKEFLKEIPLEYIVLETDSPYLTPHPYRGQKNEPKYIDTIALFVANTYGISKSQLSEITNANIARIFDI